MTGKNSFRRVGMHCPRAIGGLISACALAGCVSFNPPYWGASVPTVDHRGERAARTLSLTIPSDVEYYLALHVRTYDSMISQAEAGRVLLELPVVVSTVALPAGLALEKSDKFAIRMATTGIAGSAASTWVQPRQRLTHAVQARDAITCVRREYIHQDEYQRTLEALTRASAERAAAMTSLPSAPLKYTATGTNLTAASYNTMWKVVLRAISPDQSERGRIAVAAADEIVSRLKGRLANIGAAPDFSGTLAMIRSQYESAQSRAEAVTESPEAQTLFAAGGQSEIEDAVEKVAEYPARIGECVAKVL